MFQPIKEDFLHYLWKTKKVKPEDLVTTAGIEVQIVDYGTYNLDSGPDFFNAKVKIEDTLWAGNIEMHVFSSDWKTHGHSNDKAYDNVILHVVYEHDIDPEKDPKLAKIPTIELKGRIPKIYLDRYLALMQSQDVIPCQRLIGHVDSTKIELWKHALIVERLHQKANHAAAVLYQHNQDWESTLYVMLARYFGAKVNTAPFEMLAQNLPLQIILKNIDKPLSIEALVFGQAGMLKANYSDDYYRTLQEEYKFLQKKYELTPIQEVAWKFSKMRPVNFPTVRLAQFAALLQKEIHLFSRLKAIDRLEDLYPILEARPHDFWKTHFRFGKESPESEKNISKGFIDLLIMNTLAPIMYLYGKTMQEEIYIDRALQWLEAIKPEQNHVIKAWKDIGIRSKSAFDTQALLHLKQNYCDNFNCLNCKIGHEIIGKIV
ncbi:MAG: DUF2851 family protein [Chitinophagales bacterium]|nr:DUF2851 family protein [Chitinophagales bacterium]